MAILLGKSQCERRIPSRNDTKFITQFSTAHRQFIPIINNNSSHYYWQFITLTTVNLSQSLTAIYHIIDGKLSQLVMAIITGHSPCMDKEFQHPNDTHRFYITGPLDMMMMMVDWIIR